MPSPDSRTIRWTVHLSAQEYHFLELLRCNWDESFNTLSRAALIMALAERTGGESFTPAVQEAWQHVERELRRTNDHVGYGGRPPKVNLPLTCDRHASIFIHKLAAASPHPRGDGQPPNLIPQAPGDFHPAETGEFHSDVDTVYLGHETSIQVQSQRRLLLQVPCCLVPEIPAASPCRWRGCTSEGGGSRCCAGGASGDH